MDARTLQLLKTFLDKSVADIPNHLLCLDISFASYFGAKPVVVVIVVVVVVFVAFLNHPFLVFPLKTTHFQMSQFSNDSTLNSVCKCLRCRPFQRETLTQKRRHATPFSYENELMETGPESKVFSLKFRI